MGMDMQGYQPQLGNPYPQPQGVRIANDADAAANDNADAARRRQLSDSVRSIIVTKRSRHAAD